MMNRRKALSIVVLITLIFGLFPLTQEVNAATKSKKKTIYVPVKVTSYNLYSGVRSTHIIKYNKQGLPVSILYNSEIYPTSEDNEKTSAIHEDYSYTKKGHLKKRVLINNGEQVDYVKVTTNKKGLVTKQKGKEMSGQNVTVTYKYDKQGRMTKETRHSSITVSITYDKYGNETSELSDFGKTVYTNKLNKRKDVIVSSAKYYEQGSLMDTWTIKRSYKYDKKGNIIKCVRKGEYIVKYKYKKLRVSKSRYNYLKWFKDHAMRPDLTQYIDLI